MGTGQNGVVRQETKALRHGWILTLGQRTLIAGLLFRLVVNTCWAASGTWTNTNSGTLIWGSTSNWSGGIIADGAGCAALINTNISGNRTISLGSSRTLGSLSMGDTDGNSKNTLSPGPGVTLTLDNLGAGAKIDQLAGSFGDSIVVPLLLNDNLTVTNEAPNDLSISGGIASVSSKTNLTLKAGAVGGFSILSGTLNFNGTLTNSGTGAGVTNIDAEIGANVTDIFQSSSTSTLILAGANTKFTGQITLVSGTLRAKVSENALGAGSLRIEGGTLQLANNTGLAFNRNTTVEADAAIQSDRLQGSSGPGVTHTLGALAIGASTLTISNGSSVISGTAGVVFGAVTLTGNACFNTVSGAMLKLGSISGGGQTFTVDGNGITSIEGTIDSSVGGLFKSGGGLLLLSASNSYTGATTLSAGSLRLGNANALGNPNNDLTLNGGALDLNGNSISIGRLSGSNSATLSSGISGSVTVTLSGSGASTFAGAIQNGLGTVGVTKSGAGTLVFAGTNSYTGATRITGGKLLVSGSLNGTASVNVSGGELSVDGGINSSASVTIGNGAVLTGIGTLGPVILTLGGTIAPGDTGGVGKLSVGTLSGTSGAALSVQLGTVTRGTSLVAGQDYDQVVTTGNVSLSGITLSITTTNVRNGDLFFIILNGGSSAVAGTFVDGTGGVLGQNAQFSVGGQLFQISYTGEVGTASLTGGNDVALVAIPEPEPGILAVGVVMIVFLKRRISKYLSGNGC